MPSLKDLRNRISSVRSTQKITSAMKMVAASKLRRAQEQAEAGRPYAEMMARMLASLSRAVAAGGQGPKLMTGTGRDDTHLLLVVTSDRGLAGGFNSNVVREARRRIRQLQDEGRKVKLFCIGRKSRDLLRRDHGDKILDSVVDLGQRGVGFADARAISERLLAWYAAGEFDVATLVYNRFKSIIAQVVTQQQIVPAALPEADPDPAAGGAAGRAVHEFEPDEETILAELLPRNLSVQIYRALLESTAGEWAARMTAMDNATRNAGEMIGKLTLVYNRTRQANITKELIEIISGAEAV